MNDQQRESTGRTVDEAVREALLRMGLRREEVEVTVIQEARSGLLGLGKRQAVVRVVKKAGKAGATDGGRRERTGTGGRAARDGERFDAEASGRRDQRRSRGGRRGRPQGIEEVRGSERRTSGRGDDARRNAATVAPAQKPVEAEPARGAMEATQAPGRRTAQEDPGGDEAQRRRRPRRRRRKSDAEFTPAAEMPKPVDDAATAETPDAMAPVAAEPWSQTAPAFATVAERATGPEDDQRSAPTASDAPYTPQVPAVPAPEASWRRPEPQPRAGSSETALAADVAPGARVESFDDAEAAALPGFLQRVATELMVKSGFPCRVQVQEGEYHLVKMVVDDRSAGVLIGRYGNTVDAIEHLVEKIASKAAGERVRMNLDINNYRLRREDQLIQRARAAANEARDTGQPVALEPVGGRERRIVHLYIQDTGDLTTYTEAGPDGKYVVVCRDDQVPPEYRQREDRAGGEDESEDGTAPQIEVSVVLDVDAGERPTGPGYER